MISADLLRDIIFESIANSVAKTIILMILGTLTVIMPYIGGLLFILFIAMGLLKSLKNVIKAIPLALISLVVFGLLFFNDVLMLVDKNIVIQNISMSTITKMHSFDEFIFWFQSLPYARYVIPIYTIISLIFSFFIVFELSTQRHIPYDFSLYFDLNMRSLIFFICVIIMGVFIFGFILFTAILSLNKTFSN